jgi:anti-anti-sigma factor
MGRTSVAAIVEADDGRRIVEAVGEIDLATADALERAIAELVSLGAPEVVVDASGVSFIDSSGLAVLVRAARGERPFRLRRPSPAVAELLVMAGLTDQVPTEA